MKHSILSFTMLLLVVTSFAQSEKYQKGMERAIAALDTAKTSDDLNNIAAMFERIADAEKTQWLPYYYASLATLRKGFANQQANKDDVATKAETLIEKAESIKPKNSELYVLKNMALTLHMLVDPPARFMQLGTKMSEALGIARQLDANNPRVYLMEGQSVFGTPPQFGGGKDKAKPLFEKALALYNSEKPTSALHPSWGKETATALLARCN